MKQQIADLKKLIDDTIINLKVHKQIVFEFELGDVLMNLYDESINLIELLVKTAIDRELKINYLNQFQTIIQNISNSLPYRGNHDTQFLKHQNKIQVCSQLENTQGSIHQNNNSIKFSLDFFQKISYFNSNVVAIGANGSGKTSLSEKLKTYLPKNGVVVSAQRILIIPTFSGISNISKTTQKLATSQLADKSYKATFTTENNQTSFHLLSQLGDEFRILLDNLLAERSTLRNKFCDSLKNGGKDTNVPITNLDKALIIWNSLIEHRTIECNDGINITLKSKNIEPYPAYQMSDGEKVVLYLVAQILQAPNSGFIIVDEPEMYLHKTILKKLWDILEKERHDCIFIYLTHDLDFAVSRNTAKKIWIRSFDYPDDWKIESIPENDLPESLLLELLGSRKNILFCEGSVGSIDEKIYNILFPQYTVTPVGNCFQVINHTKAFNKIPNLNIKAFGLIDSDHQSVERLASLKKENVYSFRLAEPENLLLDEEILLELAKNFMVDSKEVNQIKVEIIQELEKEKELQVSNYLTAKIDYYFKDTNVKKGNNLASVKANYTQFTKEINPDDWYNKRIELINKIIGEKDYAAIISIFNNKGLKRIAERNLKISEFTERAIKLLQLNSHTHGYLMKYFPDELKK